MSSFPRLFKTRFIYEGQRQTSPGKPCCLHPNAAEYTSVPSAQVLGFAVLGQLIPCLRLPVRCTQTGAYTHQAGGTAASSRIRGIPYPVCVP